MKKTYRNAKQLKPSTEAVARKLQAAIRRYDKMEAQKRELYVSIRAMRDQLTEDLRDQIKKTAYGNALDFHLNTLRRQNEQLNPLREAVSRIMKKNKLAQLLGITEYYLPYNKAQQVAQKGSK